VIAYFFEGCGCVHFIKVQHNLKTVFVILCILLFHTLIPITLADNGTDSIVDAQFDIEFISGTKLKLNVIMDVKQITVFSSTYGKSEIQVLANDDLETMGAIKLRLRQMLEEQIEVTFEFADITALMNKPTYENGQFYDEYSIILNSAFFDLNRSINTSDFINGLLDMDAVIFYDFTFHAVLGWNNSYEIILSEHMTYRYTTGSVENNRIRWELKNSDGANSEVLAEISIKFIEPTTPKGTEDSLHIEFELNANSVDTIGLKSTILIHSMDILEYNILPDFVDELQFVPSDGIRLFIDNKLISWNNIYLKTIKPLEKKIIQTIENSSFNQTLEISFNWDPETTINCSTYKKYNVTNMDTTPPLKANLLDDNIRLILFDMPARAFFGLVNAGARANISEEDINFGDGFNAIGYPYDIFLRLPNNISLNGEYIYVWNLSSKISGGFQSDLQPIPDYSNEQIDVLIEIEISKMDLDLLSFFTGETKLTASLYIKEDCSIYVMGFPNEFDISNKINLSYLNSDAIRLCIEENVFSGNDVDAFLTNKKISFEKRLSDVFINLDIRGIVNKDAFYTSLLWDGDISNMDRLIPAIVSIYSYNIYPVDFDIAFWPPDISISNQTFKLKGLENQTVAYRIIFPKGISINAKDSINKTIIKGKTHDGNEYIELSFGAHEGSEMDTIFAEISVTPFYILGLFLPCILSLVLVIALIVVIFFIRKKRKGGGIIKEDIDSTGYEGQEYYVPPPKSR
jgi:hypothetical protein